MENDKWCLEMDRGGASIYIMSNLVTFIVPREEGTKHDYSFYKNVSIQLIKIALKNNKGVIFNFEGYAQDLIDEFDSGFYFSLSDDFLQTNSNFASDFSICDFVTKEDRDKFKNVFHVFDDLANCLVQNKIFNFDLIIDLDGCEKSIDDFEIVHLFSTNISDAIYDTILYNIRSSKTIDIEPHIFKIQFR